MVKPMIKTFAFLLPTPWNINYDKTHSSSYAGRDYKKCGGQFNGYVGIHKSVFVDTDDEWRQSGFDDDIWSICHKEITDFFRIKLENIMSFGEQMLLTEYPKEKMELDYFIIGYDTGHINDTWEDNDFDAVKNVTLRIKDVIDGIISENEKNSTNNLVE